MSEIIFDKSKRNLKKIYNRLQSKSSISRMTGFEEILTAAIGGYNRTYELLITMGVDESEIATFSNLTLSGAFLQETHLKKVIYIRKINYVTDVSKTADWTKRKLSLNVADSFEESLMLYKTANRKVKVGNKVTDWIKPTIVLLDDQSLNLQFGGHRFRYANEIGFVQIRNRNTPPFKIIDEIKGDDIKEADKMMFALYQDNGADEAEILDVLNKLQTSVSRNAGDGYWYMKPTEFKQVCRSNELATVLKDMKELDIKQLSSNKKFGKENARWVVIHESAFEFKGFDYKDEDEVFDEQIQQEMESEREYAEHQERMFRAIMDEEYTINVQYGYMNANLYPTNVTLQDFVNDVDSIDEHVGGIDLLTNADKSSEDEYKLVKKQNLVYFIDGQFKDNYRENDNYMGGRRLVSIDVDDGDYTREEIESRLESQGLFGIIYPTAKHYYNGSNRWRVILVADNEMDKEQYKNTIEGVAEMIDIEIDQSSKKVAQVMGYPLKGDDVSYVIGTKVNVAQFKPQPKPTVQNDYSGTNVVNFNNTTKTLLEVNHKQAQLLNQAINSGIPEGQRNDSYHQIVKFLRETQQDPKYSQWHDEARYYEENLVDYMAKDGLDEKEMEAIMR